MLFEMKTYAEFKQAVSQLSDFLFKQKLSEDVVFDSKLVIHELIGNALQHSEGGASFSAEVVDGCVRISVRGEEKFYPPKESRLPTRYAERGRGLYLVDSLSAERTVTDDGEVIVIIRIR